MWKPVVYLDKC